MDGLTNQFEYTKTCVKTCQKYARLLAIVYAMVLSAI